MLSSKTTDIYDYSKQNTVVGSNVSAGEIAISSKKDTNITGSNVVADNDVNVKTGGNLNIGSAEQTSESEYRKSVKKSGVFAGGGLGFTIGKEKQKDQYANQNTEQVGSTVGSVKGNVNLDADKAANVKGSTVVAGKDINITGENVSIENSNSIYNAQEKHEFKRTGLSVSVGGGYVDVVNNAANSVKHATEVEDKRLGALVAVKGYKDADQAIKDIKGKGGGKINENLYVNISLGTTKSKSESNSTTTVANASEVKAGGDVSIVSAKKDINITGSNVEGKDVTLNAKENLNIIASENTNNTEQSSKSSSASVGASLELGKGPSYSISGSMSKGEVSANGTTYNESTVTANKDLSFASGNDTNIKGGMLSGEKVTGNVGGDLNIESKQDSNSYKETNKSVGVSIGLGSNKAVSGSASIGKIDSNYKSVTDQSGIYAGTEGFDINVGENTDLKGGIIFSEAEKDKNKISTGTLTFEDIRNKADYKSGGAGVKVNKNNDAEYNEKGITPDIGMPASGEAESTTKAAISEGTIEIRDKENQKQDIEKLNRDPNNSLNKLGEIFDKTKIEERQELANLFGELAYNEIHYMDGSDEQKALYHAVVGGIMSKLTGGDFLAGASAAGINKLVIEEIVKVADGDPDKAQWVSAVLGAVISGLVSGNTQAGASIAASGTKNNYWHDFMENMINKIDVDELEENKAYAILINGAYGPGGVTVGCYVVKDPNNPKDLIIYDTTAVSLQPLNKGRGVGFTMVEVDFGSGENAVDKIEGWSVSGSIDFASIHVGASWSSNGEQISSEAGLSSEFKAAIAAGLSNTIKIGNRSDKNIWISYDEVISEYLHDNPNGNYSIVYNEDKTKMKVVRKNNGYYEMLTNIGNKPVWIPIKSNSIPF